MKFPGGQRGIEKLVDAYYAALYRYAYRLTSSATEAEDLTQEAYCHAQQKLHQLRDPAKAKPWLFSILRNVYLHRLRASKNQPVIPLDWVGDVPEAAPEPLPEVDPEQLQKALNELSEVYRTPIILYYFEEF